MIREQVRSAASEVPVLIARPGRHCGVAFGCSWPACSGRPTPAGILLGVAGVLASMFVLMGLKVVNPNEARVAAAVRQLPGHRQDAGPALGARRS